MLKINKLQRGLLLVFLLFGLVAQAQVKKDFNPRYNSTITGEITMVANNILSRTATTDYQGEQDNHDFTNNVYVDIDSDNSTFNSSSANLVNPRPNDSCLEVDKVLLYWAAADKGINTAGVESENEPNWNYNNVKLMLPGQTTYTTIIADDVIYRGRNENPHLNNDPYVCVKDITNTVKNLADPFGKYQVANIEARTGYLVSHGNTNTGTSGGWQIIMVYKSDKLKTKNITLFDGYANVTSAQNNFNVNFSGFQTVPNGKVKADIVIGALEGDRSLSGDRLQILNASNTFVDVDAPLRSENNFFNSRITVGPSNGANNFTDRNPASLNTLGFDAAVFPLSNNGNSILTNNQTSATFRLTSNQETYGLFVLGFSVEVYQPNLETIFTATPAAITPSDTPETVTYSATITNIGNDNADNVVLSTVIPLGSEVVLPITGLPSGITYNYNNSTRVLIFNVPNGILLSGESLTLSYNSTINVSCYYLTNQCSDVLNSILTATYTGELNIKDFSNNSSNSFDSCGIGNSLATPVTVNAPPAATWVTLPEALDRDISCTDAAGLISAQSLAPIASCSGLTLVKTSGDFVASNNCPSNGTYTNTWNFTDSCGRTIANYVQTITVTDTTPPTFTAPENTEIFTDSSCNYDASTTITGEVTDEADNCSTTLNATFTDNIIDGTCPGTFVINRTWSLVDECGNASATQIQTITVSDTTPPSFVAPLPANGTVDFDAIPDAAILTATDNCGNANVTFNESTTDDICTGAITITRTWIATDECNLTTEHTQILTVTQALLTASITTVTNVACNSDANGSIDIAISGGTEPYMYVWNDVNNSTNQDLSNVIAGAYSVTITDDNGCTTNIGATISEPSSPLSLNITKVDATTAQGCANGEATAIVSGGTTDYTYQWSSSAGNATTALVTGLSDGTHSVTITDGNNCTITQSIVIECVNTCDAEIDITNITDVLCTGDTTGAGTVTANSDANPSATFTFTWSSGQVNTGVTSSTLENLTAGVYSVSVTIDGTVCQAVEETISITEPSNALDVTATTTDELGPATDDGTATAVVTGGVEPYTYSWSPGGESTSVITGLSAGDYTITVTDANDCKDSTTVTVNPGSCNNLSVTGTSSPAICFGESNGSVAATVTGGSGSFTYAWDTISNTTTSVSNLSAGDHTITVTDAITSCTTSTTITINEPNILSSAIAVSNILCKDYATGSLDLAVNGGNGGYTFLWDNGETTEDLINVVAGTYSVTITDSEGCQSTNSATIIEPTTNVSVTITTQSDIICEGLGTIIVEGAGGINPYSYSIDGGTNYQTSGTFSNLPEANYTITVIDANGCGTTISTNILINCTDAITDINNTFQDEEVSGNVLTNDEDFEGDNQTVTANTNPANGTVTIDAAGNYTYTPNAGFTGEDTFTYTICDDGNPQACDTATVYIEVLTVSGPENEAPIANADTATTPEGTEIEITVLTNDFDPDGDTIVVTNTTTPDNGTVTVDPTGVITYTPNDGFIGEDTFTYTICDDANPALCDTATVTVTVQPTDTPNTTNANDDAYTTTPGADVMQNVLVNDNDIEGDTQLVTANTNPTNGTVTMSPNGDFTYTPNPGYTGADSFTYTICDDNADQACDTATVYITVGGIANTTDAIADINNTFQDQPVTGNVLTNDEDFEGDNQTVTANTNPANGTVTIDAAGNYTYTPNAGFTGEDTFTYTICDDGNPQACDTATVYIEVLPVSGPENEAPIANADTATTPEGTPITITVISNDFDPDGDTITVTNTTTPDNGTVTVDPITGEIIYTPNDGFIGEDTFTYTICDDANPALCDTATVTVTVQPTDTPNTTNANDDAYTTTPGADVTQNVLVNDNDIEGDDQTVTANTNPTNGTVTISPTGEFTYTPNSGFNGTDSFTYTICDDNTDQACDTATVYITIGGIANTTDAIADINNTFQDQPVTGNVLTNDEDFEGDNQTVTANTDPANGTVTIDAAGNYTYTPNTGFTGEDTFTYTICDDGSPQACDTATVYIEVLPVSSPRNEAPIANADTATTPEATEIEITVLTNDFDPDGDTIVVTNTTTPDNGTVTVDPTGVITYTPNDGFTGEDTFTYTICDDANPALCDTATVTVTVQPTDTPNTTNANDDAYFTTPTSPLTANVLVNDNDIEGNNQTVTANTNPTNGTVTISPNGDFTYTPNPGFSGTDSFTYTICDDNTDQACDTATVYITINGIAGLNVVKAAFNANGNLCIVAGDLVTYTFTVTNPGDLLISSITITDTLLGGDITADVTLTGDTNNDGLLDPSETWVYTAPNYTVTQENVDTGLITNSVTVTGLEPDGTTSIQATDTYVIDENNTEVTFCTPTNGLNIVKSAAIANGEACLVLGSEVTYTFTVTNTGTVSINTVTITDALLGGDITADLVLAGDTNTNGVIEPTETWSYTTNNYTVTQADVDAGSITNTVTVDGIEILGNTDVTATDTYVIDQNNTEVTFCTPTNGLNIVKSAAIANGEACLVLGSEVTYTFTVTNTGTVSINTVTITDALLGGDITADLVLAGDTNTNGVIEPTETWIYTASNYTVTQADVDAGMITNTVTVDGIEILGNTDVTATDTYVIDQNNTEVTFCTPTNGLNIVKSAAIANGEACLVLGSEVTYTFTVTNTGTVSINTVTITDALLGGDITADLVLAGDTNTNGVIEPTETWIYTASNYTVTQADVDAGMITNTVTVDGIEILGNTDVTATDTYVIDQNNTEVTFCTPTNGLNIVKSAAIANGEACLVLGSEVTYTFTVTNTGTVSINTVTITDALLGGAITADLVLAGDTNSNGVIEPTETWIYTANNYTVTQADVDAGIITNTVTVDGIEILGNTDVTATDTYVIDQNNTEVTFCTPTNGLNIVKSATIANGEACLVLGSEVTYTFTVTNTGTVSINTVTITDALLGGAITADLVLAGDTNSNGVIEPTETWIYTANNYTVTQADVDAGIITNTVTVDGIEILGNTDVTATDTYVIDQNNTEVTFCTPTNGLNIVKSAAIANGEACLVLGSEVTYTFTVTNTGTVSINTVTITDALLGGDITADLVLAGDTNTNGVIEPTETWIYTASNYTVTQADVDAGMITNTVTVDGIEILGNTDVTATDTYVIDQNNTEVTFCTPTNGLNIVKSATIANGEACLVLGSEVTYTFTVTNTGTVSINTVTITDALLGGAITADLVLAGDTNSNGVIEPTETWIYTANNYTVTQADVDAGIITNTVTVDGIEILGNTDVTATDTYVIDQNNTEVTFCTPTNGLNIVKSATIANGEACLVLGSEVTYTFTVTNTGTVSINTVTITDALLGGAITADLVLAGDTNTNGVIEPTETWIYTANNYTVTQADVDAGIITNTVTVDGIEILGNTTVTATDTYVIDENNTEVTFCTPTNGLNIVKSAAIANGEACLVLGSEVTYTFTVTNTGTVSINTVTITDALLGGAITADLVLAGDTNTNGMIEPTETWIYTANNYTVTQADVDAGMITNTVTVNGIEILGNTTVTDTDTYVIDENNTEVTFCTPTNGLNIVKSAAIANGEACLVLGSEVTYTFTVTNTGTVSINTVTITDDLLGGAITADLVLAGDTNTNGVIEPTETWIYTANNYTVTQADVDAGMITNTVTVDGIEILGNTDVTATDTYVIDENNTEVTFCTPTNGLNIVKSAAIANGEECLVVGSEVTYTFTVTNTGTVSINTVTITDALLGGAITADLVLAGDTNTNGVIEPTETWIYTANNYTVTQADVDAGSITNTVTVDGIEILGNTEVTATDTYVIDENNTELTFCTPTNGLNIVKSAAIANGEACLVVGSEVTYTFTVTNTGTVSINTVTITDDLLGGAITADLVLAGDTNTNGVIEPTETWFYTANNYTVTQADVDAGSITNTVTVDGIEILGNTTVTDTDTYVIDENNTEVTFCTPTNGLNIVKSAEIANGEACLVLGSEVTYTFTVTNTGTVSVNSITITDALLGGAITADLVLAGDTNTNGVIEPTETWIYTANNYTVTQADVDAGIITNTVTVDGIEILGNTEVTATDTYVIDQTNTDVTFCTPTAIIDIIKTGVFNNDNSNDCTEVDETITYTFTVTNSGTLSLENIIITDPLLDNAATPVSVTYVSGDANNNNILESTETWIYTATYLVTQLDIDATEVVNTATVIATAILNGETTTATSQTTTELIEDTTPPNVSTCAVLDETIECDGENNNLLAEIWNEANITALENCATDACDNTFTVTSNYDFTNLVSTCGASGTIEVIYTLTDTTGNASTFTATVSIVDTTGPALTIPLDLPSSVTCSNVPEIPELVFDDNCSITDVQVVFEETTTFTGSEEVYDVTWTWIATDNCGNDTVITHTINVTTENFITPLTADRCTEDGLLDLYEFLPADADTDIEWDVLTDGITIVDGIFDPLEIAVGDYVFTYTSLNNGCLNTYELTITINDDCIVLPCGEDDLKISKAVTPNGDNYNEFFTVGGLNECGFIIDLKIFNRFGDIVYESRDYQNDWNGQSPSGSVGSAGRLPNGTYYYVINILDSGIKPLAGPIYLGTK
ncbi:Ig-like domain-containing protein [Olleya sp. HaHaR_3_96]|uniref:DUF7507 domain-containing protein n=1 Tax=Olleya sp. HaHaR_3_96 TaxID=2745560 RepID=UPI001C4F6FB6|nr:Ig-like domain-containing protein [Olleya sp. HaHaR_3_96]QXP58519.1 tandem-95 repeat protein [Olleya sp. HaHaR_3_96]